MNPEFKAQGTWIIVLSFLLAMVLAVVPLPQLLNWARPEWVLLVFLYWVIALPHRIGIFVGAILGLLVDVLIGAPLGLNAATMALVAYVLLLQHQRVKMFPLLQQTALIFLLVGVNQLINFWLYEFFMDSPREMGIITPAITSAIVWPFVFGLLQHFHVVFRVR